MSEPTASDTVRHLHREYLWPAVANYYSESVVADRGSGARLTDLDGRTYLDFFGGILTVSIGHADARVGAAAKLQIDRLVHMSSVYPALPVVKLAETLARITPGDLKQSIFTPSGTDAVDTAITLSQVFTGAQEVIALRHGYHGRGTLAQSLTGLAAWRAVPAQVASVRHAPAPYCYRCPLGLAYPGCGIKCATDLEELVQTTTSGKVAAFVAEPVLGVGGFITPPPEYFRIAVDIVRKYGGLFVCDEVQTGFGRTGRMFGIEHYGVEPDVMTLAKGIANGFPIAATIARPEVAAAWQKLTISTFGGSPVSAAAAGATLAIMEAEDLAGNAAARGARLRAGLEALKARFRTIGDVRGHGLMLGVELVADEPAGDRTPAPATVGRLMEAARDRGLLMGKGGLHGNVVRLGPPLTITDADVDEALEALEGAFESLGG